MTNCCGKESFLAGIFTHTVHSIKTKGELVVCMQVCQAKGTRTNVRNVDGNA